MKYFINKFAAFFLVFVTASSACKNDPEVQARKMKTCPSLGCTSPNICLSPLNICVKPCLDHKDCATGFKCSGYFKSIFNFTGKGDKFCKQINAGLGDDCSDFNTACPRDMSCVDGICKKICTADDDCLNQNYRCVMQVLPAKSFNADQTYRVCAKANADFQNKCRAGSEPFCKKGLICVDNKCRKKCETNQNCPPGYKCQGRGFIGWKGQIKYFTKSPADFYYCEK